MKLPPLPPKWSIKGDILTDNTGYARHVSDGGKVDRFKVATVLENHGLVEHARSWNGGVLPSVALGLADKTEFPDKRPVFEMPDIPTGDWKHWPTYWGGGSGAVKVDGMNVPWVEREEGDEICRINPRTPYRQFISLVQALSALPHLLRLALRISRLRVSSTVDGGKSVLIDTSEMANILNDATTALRKAGAPEKTSN